MATDRRLRIEERLCVARELPPAEHSTFPERNCKDDPEVRSEVESSQT